MHDLVAYGDPYVQACTCATCVLTGPVSDKGRRSENRHFSRALVADKLENPNVYIAQELEGIENIRLLILPGN